MYTGCYLCGQEGHRRSECPSRMRVPEPAPGLPPAPEVTYTPPPYHAPDAVPHPPTDLYLRAKESMGWPAQSNLGRLLQVACPWCGAGKRSYCRNPATGQRKLEMHEARYMAALAPLPSRAPHADLAAEQVAESRATRTVLP